jgi:hypothetical protein
MAIGRRLRRLDADAMEIRARLRRLDVDAVEIRARLLGKEHPDTGR